MPATKEQIWQIIAENNISGVNGHKGTILEPGTEPAGYPVW